jgi:putative spermidine/putrescine transport system substrate-binding protein
MLLTRRSTIGALLAAGALAFAACGDDDDGGGGGGGGQSDGGGEDVTLTIGGWGGAINEATQSFYLSPFAESGSDARFVDAPGTQLARVESQAQAGNIEWDALDSVAGDAAFTLNTEGRLAPLPADLRSKLETELGAERVTDFGFSHANVGNVIVCNLDEVKACPKTMAEFFDVEAFPGDRMFGGIGAMMSVAAAQSAAGVPGDQITSEPPDLDQAFAKLEEVKPAIRVFWTSGDQQLQIMRSGEAAMGIMWSGRAYELVDEGMKLEVNWDGGVYEPSYWAVVKDAPNEAQAFDLLEWIATNPDAQAQWAQELNYSVPNPKALESLPEDFAAKLADEPSNFEQLVTPNFEWYAENTKELNSRYENFVRG